MPTITWGPELETGIDIIDRQHRHWTELMNDLVDAVKEGRGLDQVGTTLAELADYSISHFRTEEGLMKRANYDKEELDLHLREHRVFTSQVAMYKDRVELQQIQLSIQVAEYMREWLVQHITGSDRDYIDAMTAAGIS